MINNLHVLMGLGSRYLHVGISVSVIEISTYVYAILKSHVYQMFAPPVCLLHM